jgi:hypothetical protein
MLFFPSFKAWVEKLPDGHQGTMRTLEVMRWLVRKDYKDCFTRSFVAEVIKEGSQCGLSPVDSLFIYARDSIRFVEDPPDVELVQDFRRTVEAGQGDCDDKAVWLATALLSLGISARFVIQSYGAQWLNPWDHVYLEYWDWDQWQWVALDPTADGHTGIVAEVGWRQGLSPRGYEMRYSI